MSKWYLSTARAALPGTEGHLATAKFELLTGALSVTGMAETLHGIYELKMERRQIKTNERTSNSGRLRTLLPPLWSVNSNSYNSDPFGLQCPGIVF